MTSMISILNMTNERRPLYNEIEDDNKERIL